MQNTLLILLFSKLISFVSTRRAMCSYSGHCDSSSCQEIAFFYNRFFGNQMYILRSNDDTSFSLYHHLDELVRPIFYWMIIGETSKALLLLLIKAGRFTTRDALGSALFVVVNRCKWEFMHILSSHVVYYVVHQLNIFYFARQHGPLWRQQGLSWSWDIRSPLWFCEGFIYYHLRQREALLAPERAVLSSKITNV